MRSAFPALALALLAAPSALAGPQENVADKDAKDALEKFEAAFATEDLDFKVEAVERLRKVLHPLVAERLFKVAVGDPQAMVRAAAFRGIGLQKPSKGALGPKLCKFLSDAAEASRKAKARGDYGIRIDTKTGEVDTESDEGKAALRAKREKGKMLAEAVRALDALGCRERDSVDCLREFLGDGNDDLVALCLGMFGKWKEWSVLSPDLLFLFELYPNENDFETGSISVDTGAAGSADAQAAKRKWNAKYGDPDKRRPRPVVVKALKKALFDITGQEFADPKALREYVGRPEVKRKIKYGGK